MKRGLLVDYVRRACPTKGLLLCDMGLLSCSGRHLQRAFKQAVFYTGPRQGAANDFRIVHFFIKAQKLVNLRTNIY